MWRKEKENKVRVSIKRLLNGGQRVRCSNLILVNDNLIIHS